MTAALIERKAKGNTSRIVSNKIYNNRIPKLNRTPNKKNYPPKTMSSPIKLSKHIPNMDTRSIITICMTANIGLIEYGILNRIGT